MKQTAEEAAEKWVFETNGHKWSNNDDTAGDNFASFIAGAKWQKEQDKNKYSEENMKLSFEAGKKGYMRGSMLHQEYYFTWKNFKQWFEQFKKK